MLSKQAKSGVGTIERREFLQIGDNSDHSAAFCDCFARPVSRHNRPCLPRNLRSGPRRSSGESASVRHRRALENFRKCVGVVDRRAERYPLARRGHALMCRERIVRAGLRWPGPSCCRCDDTAAEVSLTACSSAVPRDTEVCATSALNKTA